MFYLTVILTLQRQWTIVCCSAHPQQSSGQQAAGHQVCLHSGLHLGCVCLVSFSTHSVFLFLAEAARAGACSLLTSLGDVLFLPEILNQNTQEDGVADPVVAGSQPRPKPRFKSALKTCPQKAGLPMHTQFTLKQNKTETTRNAKKFLATIY